MAANEQFPFQKATNLALNPKPLLQAITTKPTHNEQRSRIENSSLNSIISEIEINSPRIA